MKTREDRRAYQAAWYRAHREEAKAYQLQYAARRRANAKMKRLKALGNQPDSGRGERFSVEPCTTEEWWIQKPQLTLPTTRSLTKRMSPEKFAKKIESILEELYR